MSTMDSTAVQHSARMLAGASDIDRDAILAALPDAPIDDLDVFREWIGDRPDLLDAIRAVNLDKPAQTEPVSLSLCPPLPDGARPDPALGEGAGRWVDLYADYAAQVSPMTPRSFHIGAALWLISVPIARRLVLRMAFEDIYPNLFVLWLAATTIFRKTTALEVARRIARAVFPFLLLPQDFSVEAFLSDLAGREPAYFEQLMPDEAECWRKERDHAAQRGLVLDETSGLLASAGRDYNRGLIEVFLRCSNCDPSFRRLTRGQGRIAIRNSYMSLLTASTPSALSSHLGYNRLWTNGFWTRFAILTPEGLPEWKTSREAQEPKDLRAQLRRLYERLPKVSWPGTPEVLTVVLGDGVYDAWEKFNKAVTFDLLLRGEISDPRLTGTYGRIPVQALKVSTLLAAMDWCTSTGKTPIVELAHLSRAISIVDCWRESTHRALDLAAEARSDDLQGRILAVVEAAGADGVEARYVYRKLHLKADVAKSILNALVDIGELDVMTVKPEGGGRSSEVYKVAM